MTTVRIAGVGEKICEMSVCGHSGFAPNGEDIVCAGLSILMTTCINALETVAGIVPTVTQNEKCALMALSLSETDGNADTHRDAQIILRTILQGFRDMSLVYPKYVTIIDGRQSLC